MNSSASLAGFVTSVNVLYDVSARDNDSNGIDISNYAGPVGYVYSYTYGDYVYAIDNTVDGAAIGNTASPDLDPAGVSFWLDDVLVVDHGGRSAAYREDDGKRVMQQQEIGIRVALSRGAAAATVWTCDFSHDYVSINADYRS